MLVDESEVTPSSQECKAKFYLFSHLNIVHKEGLGRRDGHGCICFAGLYVRLGHLMPIQ